ncbi:MAG: hypothetical protein POELPBGB_02413 [Bacteroidia bacterium]|nr:hypothetical protein [Bacteroidia bacterium]
MKTSLRHLVNTMFIAVITLLLTPTLQAQNPFFHYPEGEKVTGGGEYRNNESENISYYSTSNCLYVKDRVLFLGTSEYFLRKIFCAPEGKKIVKTIAYYTFLPNSIIPSFYYLVLLDDGSLYIIDAGSEEILSPYNNLPGIPNQTYKELLAGTPFDSHRSNQSPVIYVLSSAAVFASHDFMATWAVDTVGLGTNTVRDLETDTAYNIYAATSGGLFKKDSTGTNDWARVTTLGTPNLQHAFAAYNGHLYASSSNRIWKSTDNGSSWNLDTLGIGTQKAEVFRDDSLNNMYVIINTGFNSGSGNKIYRKLWGSNQWQRVDQPISNLLDDTRYPYIFKDLTSTDTTLIALTNYGIYYTKDYGASWNEFNKGLNANTFSGMVFNNQHRQFLSTGNGIFMRNESDSVWVKSFPQNGRLLGGQPLYRDNAGNLYTLGKELSTVPAYSPRITYKSTDEGQTWNPDSLGLSAIAANFSYSIWLVDPAGNQYLAVTGSGSPNAMRMYSKQPGQPWQADNNGFTGGNYDQPTALGSDNAGNIYLGKSGSANCWKRNSSGLWTDISSGLGTGNSPYSFSVNSSGTLVAGTSNGVYQFNGTNSWSEISQPAVNGVMGSSNAFAVHFDNSNYLFTCYANYDNSFNDWAVDVFSTNDLGNAWTNYGLDSITYKMFVSHNDTTYGLSYQSGIYYFLNGNLTTGISNQQPANTLTLFPNPAHNQVIVESGISKGQYTLRDVTGKLLLTASVNAPRFLADISSLSSGVYFITLTGNEQQYTGKIIKE